MKVFRWSSHLIISQVCSWPKTSWLSLFGLYGSLYRSICSKFTGKFVDYFLSAVSGTLRRLNFLCIRQRIFIFIKLTIPGSWSLWHNFRFLFSLNYLTLIKLIENFVKFISIIWLFNWLFSGSIIVGTIYLLLELALELVWLWGFLVANGCHCPCSYEWLWLLLGHNYFPRLFFARQRLFLLRCWGARYTGSCGVSFGWYGDSWRHLWGYFGPKWRFGLWCLCSPSTGSHIRFYWYLWFRLSDCFWLWLCDRLWL